MKEKRYRVIDPDLQKRDFKKRFCEKCKAVLNSFNKGLLCWPCHNKGYAHTLTPAQKRLVERNIREVTLEASSEGEAPETP